MKTKILTLALAIALCLSGSSYRTPAQGLAKKDKNQTVTPAATGSVAGSGTQGRISKWTGVSGTSTYVLGDSNIFEDKFGKVGIGTTTPTSLLTVAGMIETTLGGYKFPDGTVQTTAGISSIMHDASLMGNGTAASPLGIAIGGVQTIHLANGVVVKSLNGLTDNVRLEGSGIITVTPSGNTLTIAATGALTGVAHDATLTGNGTAANPLGVTVPLNLTGSVPPNDVDKPGVIRAINTAAGGIGVSAFGGFGGLIAGAGVRGVGGDSDNSNGFGGTGVIGFGGVSGLGVGAIGGHGFGAGHRGGDGIVATAGFGFDGATDGLAGQFNGHVAVTGNLSKGGGSFKIDHPLDPENKYLYHSFVESPDMMNIYNGNVVTDENGEATVTLPDYFEPLNRDFRYQLTVIGQFAQVFVADEIKENRFTIKTNAPNVKVSWQVTGIRQDAFANKNRIPVEEEKPKVERGFFLHPAAFNQPEERSIQWARDPEMMQQLKQRGLEVQLARKRQPNQQ